jgi:hypothetical protein
MGRVRELTRRIHEIESDKERLAGQIADLTARIAASTASRFARKRIGSLKQPMYNFQAGAPATTAVNRVGG